MESLKGKVVSNSSFTLSNFLCVARNLEEKKIVPRDKNDQIYTTALYIHSYILWFSYAFRVCSMSVSEICNIRPVSVVGAVVTPNNDNFSCWDKTFISNRWSAESFSGSMWVKKFNLQITSMYIHFSHYANPPKCIVDTADI